MKKAILIKLALLTGLCVLAAGCSKGGGSAAGSAAQNAAALAESTAGRAESSGAAVKTEAVSASAGDSASLPQSGDGLRIAWWGSQDRHNATIKALDVYARDKGVNLSYEYTSWSSYFENLATKAVGGNLPDILQMSTTDIINYTKNQQIIDLQPFLDKKLIDVANISQDSLGGGVVDGRLMGFTTGVNTVTVLYNKDIFDEAGVAYPKDDWRWRDFLETAQKIYEKTGIQTEIPFLNEARWTVEEIIRSYGLDFFSEDGKSLPWAENDKAVAGLISIISQIRAGVEAGYFVDPEIQMAWSTGEDAYISQGKAAMSFSLSNYYANFCRALGKELGMAMLPKADDGSGTGMYMYPNMYWCISANCKAPEAAAGVINYLINDEGAAKILGVDRGVSLSAKVRETLSGAADTEVYTKNGLAYMDRVTAVVKSTNAADPLNSAEAISVLKNNYIAVMYGEMTAEDCVNDFISQAQSILS